MHGGEVVHAVVEFNELDRLLAEAVQAGYTRVDEVGEREEPVVCDTSKGPNWKAVNGGRSWST